MAAIRQAKKVLAEMAMDGIPDSNGCQRSEEVENGEHEPLVVVSLILELDDKVPRQ